MRRRLLLPLVVPGVIRIASPADDREVARRIDHFDGEDVTISLQLVGLDMLAPALEKEIIKEIRTNLSQHEASVKQKEA